ncbi:AMP-dependent synthetase [Mycobacterium colombiense]|uniref:AMP-dependent synthetase n=1 Tax=Mycobacterium colombiense TaxID=339268 RepID=A0A1A2RMD0_9MYCO|nr:AMP-binding protein [Mycobacterium colombiense]OBH52702.1 AMP-dependent synthetase [Mycobacterium colombiense]
MRAIPASLSQWYRNEGWWGDDTLGQFLAALIAHNGNAGFRVYSQVRPYTGTIADVDLIARRLAAGLQRRGVRPGDVVAFQLPNWMEAAAVFWASAYLGAVVVPIVHFYGPRELRHILADCNARVFVTAEQFGRMQYDPEVSVHIPVVGVVGSDFQDLLDEQPLAGEISTDAAAPALIAYTSGTTSAPKGVIHSHQTITCEARQLAARQPPDVNRQLTAAPVGHFIGMLGAFLLPLIQRCPVSLIDVWDPGRVLALMTSDGLHVGGGAPYFVTSLLEHPDFTAEHLGHMRYAGLGGSSVPATVTRTLADMGVTVFRAYGSTEHPSVTASHYEAPEDKRLFTDGTPMPGVEVHIAEDGEILTRGPDLCLGYTDRSLTEKVFDEDGWYHTGDIGVVDRDGYLSITDRKSDIIIRGGENISAAEVEEVLSTLPGVAEAVVVAVPDSRFGERAAAVLRMLPTAPALDLHTVREHCQRNGLARQKWPEHLLSVTDYPRTASGKVQKYQVRRIAAETLSQPVLP